MNKIPNKIKKLQKQLSEFSARGSMCPICKREFRDEYNCSHSIADVKYYLEKEIMKLISLETLMEYRKKITNE